jgi:hypothetical protein
MLGLVTAPDYRLVQRAGGDAVGVHAVPPSSPGSASTTDAPATPASPPPITSSPAMSSPPWSRPLRSDASYGQLVQQLVQVECSALLVDARKGPAPEHRTGRLGRLLDVGALRLGQRHADPLSDGGGRSQQPGSLLGVAGCGGHAGQALDTARNREGRAMLSGRRQRLLVAALGLGQLARLLLAPSKAAQGLGQPASPPIPARPLASRKIATACWWCSVARWRSPRCLASMPMPLWAAAAPTR